MKALIISCLLLLTGSKCYCQKFNDSSFLSADAYRQKAKNQNITAGILGISGLGLFVYGFSNFKLFSEKQNDNVTVPIITGSVLLASAIPFILAAGRNSNKAKKLSTSFRLQRTPPLIAAIKSTTCYLSVGIRIHF